MSETVKAVSVKRDKMSQKLYIRAHMIKDKRDTIMRVFKDYALNRMAPFKVTRYMRRNMPMLPVS